MAEEEQSVEAPPAAGSEETTIDATVEPAEAEAEAVEPAEAEAEAVKAEPVDEAESVETVEAEAEAAAGDTEGESEETAEQEDVEEVGQLEAVSAEEQQQQADENNSGEQEQEEQDDDTAIAAPTTATAETETETEPEGTHTANQENQGDASDDDRGDESENNNNSNSNSNTAVNDNEAHEAAENLQEEEQQQKKPAGERVITVCVEQQGEEKRELKVLVVPAKHRKPFLGGFRHTKTKVEYHNASAQTLRKPKEDDGKTRYHRDTQTATTSTAATNMQMTSRETSTQMTTNGCYVPAATDKVVEAGTYETAEEYFTRISTKVVLLQSCLRRWRAKRKVRDLREIRDRHQEWQMKETMRQEEAEVAEFNSKVTRRINPRNTEDFDLLYHGLERWKQEQLQQIGELPAEQQRAEKVALLNQESRYLSTIGQMKTNASVDNRERRVLALLDAMAAPKAWTEKTYNKTNEMDTPDTLRARALRETYLALKLKDLSVEERLDILLHVKQTVKGYKTRLCKDIVSLLDREADLLVRGAKAEKLEGLRQRTLNLFLQFVEDPQYNPEAKRHLAVNKTSEELRKNFHFCAYCDKYLPIQDFTISAQTQRINKCKKCSRLENAATSRKDATQYRRLLVEVQKTEKAKFVKSPVAMMMEIADLRHLVDNIWGCKSALSEHDELFHLTLRRWHAGEEWSPWNCVLLTKEEADMHEATANPETSYADAFLKRITQKHIQARHHFSKLVKLQRQKKC